MVFITFISVVVNAQVGISFNPNFVPDPSAALHLDSDKHVLQIPRVQLLSTEDNITIIFY